MGNNHWVVLIVFASFVNSAASSGCGNCWCVLDDDSEKCPPEPKNYSTSVDLQETLISQIPLNQYTLNCDPYDESVPCDTYPPLPANVSDTAVCALNYNKGCTEYNMTTYESREEAIFDGALVTHLGACGTCSTTQDLAVYMRVTDMTSAGEVCSVKALINEQAGLQCYLDMGMTLPCSWTWLYDGLYDSKVCSNLTCLSTYTFLL
jgi:hypothetical protein